MSSKRHIFALPYLADYREGFFDELERHLTGNLLIVHPRFPIDPSVRVLEHKRSLFSEPVRTFAGAFESQRHLVARIAELKPSTIVIEANTRDVSYVRLLIWARLRGIPTAIWGLGRYNRPRTRAENIGGAAMTLLLVTLATQVIGKGPGPAQYYRSYTINKRKIASAPNSSGNEGQLLDIIREPRGEISDSHPLRILFVGRLTPAKNLESLIRASSQSANPVSLHIVGDGPSRKELEELAQSLKFDKCIHFSGNLKDEELNTAFADADVLALPGKGGLVVPEALAASLPVITGPLNEAGDGTLSELLTHGMNASVSTTTDPPGLLLAIEEMIWFVNHGQLARMQSNARETYHRHGGVRAMAEIFVNFLEPKSNGQ